MESVINDALKKTEPPWIVVSDSRPEDEKLIPDKAYAPQGTGDYVIRSIRGNKIKTYEGLMNEFGAALQFFEGFGDNWPALEECLCYMDEWLPGDGYVLVVTRAELTLMEEPAADFNTFIAILHRVGAWWSEPIIDNPPYNRAAKPFHVLLFSSPGKQEFLTSRLPNTCPILKV